MKHITKGAEPTKFTEWKNQANENWVPTYEKLSGKEKRSVFDSLKEEQGYVCCYCERELSSEDYHIEHLNPQERNEIDPLDFSNMLCSCQRVLKKGEPRHCGNSKGKWYEKEKFVSPLEPDCELRFKYTYDGQIMPFDEMDEPASITIRKLQLDIDKLNDLRKSAIEPFIDEELTEEELLAFSKMYLLDKNDNDGRFNEFYTTIKYLFG